MRRGEVWWAELPEPVGRRPIVLLSRDSAYKVRSAATVVPITRTIRNIPVEVLLDQKDGLPSRCVVNADDVTTIPISVIKRRIAVLSAERMGQVEAAIRFAFEAAAMKPITSGLMSSLWARGSPAASHTRPNSP